LYQDGWEEKSFGHWNTMKSSILYVFGRFLLESLFGKIKYHVEKITPRVKLPTKKRSRKNTL